MAIDMTTRRQFFTGLIATGLVPQTTWADAGSPALLSAAALPDGSYVLCGIDACLNLLFQIPLPGRGHAAAAHPKKPQAVAFARRPGTFAIVIDCVTGQPTTKLSAPAGRHFYGHGTFSSDGNWLFTTENDFEAGHGCVGVWDVLNGYQRIDQFSSGGIGPHDIKRLPNTKTLVIANGGIDTHPDTGRTKLNIPTMTPNLAYIEQGHVVEAVSLASEFHKNSIRHLAVSASGKVAFAMQWQGDSDAPPLVGLHTRGRNVKTLAAPQEILRQMRGYIGSIAFSGDAHRIAVTSARGGRVQIYDIEGSEQILSTELTDASGAATFETGVLISSGTGILKQLSGKSGPISRTSHLRWDNHLVRL